MINEKRGGKTMKKNWIFIFVELFIIKKSSIVH